MVTKVLESLVVCCHVAVDGASGVFCERPKYAIALNEHHPDVISVTVMM